MNDRTRFIAALLATCILPGQAYAAVLTLPEALRLAYEHSPAIAKARRQLDLARSKVANAVSGFEPTVAVDAAITSGSDKVTGGTPLENSLLRSSTPHSSYDVVVDQPLYRGGRTEAELSGSIASVRAATYKLISVEQDALLQAAHDYIDVQRDRLEAEKAARTSAISSELLKGAQESVASQEGSRVDILTAQADLDEAAADETTARSRLAGDEENFRRDIGVEATELETPVIPLVLPESEDAAATLSQNNPDIVSAQYVARASDADIDVARSGGRPDAEIEAALRGRQGAVFPAEREEVRSVSLRLHVPLFSGGAVRADVAAKTAIARSADEDLLEVTQEAAAKARAAYRQWQLLTVAQERYHASVLSKQQLLSGEREMKSHAEASNTDILSAERNLLDAERAENRATHDELATKLDLCRALGEMSLHAFGVAQTKDPDPVISSRQLILDSISIPFIR